MLVFRPALWFLALPGVPLRALGQKKSHVVRHAVWYLADLARFDPAPSTLPPLRPNAETQTKRPGQYVLIDPLPEQKHPELPRGV